MLKFTSKYIACDIVHTHPMLIFTLERVACSTMHKYSILKPAWCMKVYVYLILIQKTLSNKLNKLPHWFNL